MTLHRIIPPILVLMACWAVTSAGLTMARTESASSAAPAFTPEAVHPSSLLARQSESDNKPFNGPAASHDFHVSYTRLAVEGNYAVCNIRFFKDDLREGLQARIESGDLILDASPRTDSLILSYLEEHFRIMVNNEALAGAIISSGEDVEGKEDIWWYTIQYEAPQAIETLRLANTILIEQFVDQKNIVKIQHFPSEETHTFYFDDEDKSFDIQL